MNKPARPARLDLLEAPTETRRIPDELTERQGVHESGFVPRSALPTSDEERLERRSRETLPAPPDDESGSS